MRTRIIFVSLVVLAIISTFNSCKKPEKEGNINISIIHTVDGQPAEFDQMIYKNEAGNEYQLSEIQWFISELSLIGEDGEEFLLMAADDAWYVDTDLEETMEQNFSSIPEGNYKGLSFVFGFTEETNKSHRFVNPPESFMFWPELMGGGYHYMKLNGKWLNPEGLKEPFNFHLGIGQIYEEDEIVDFVHNHFKVTLNVADLQVVGDGILDLHLSMQIENWFKEPHVYDHNEWGGAIMQNQEAMRLATENGHNVFVLKVL